MTASQFLLISAGLHVIGSVLAGFSGVGLFLLFPAVLYTAFVIGLQRGLVWIEYVALICMLGGMAGTGIELARDTTIPAWVLWGILAADGMAAVLLVQSIRSRLT
jgi:hypothetical protein